MMSCICGFFPPEHPEQLRQVPVRLLGDRGGAGEHDEHGAAHQRDEAQARARRAHTGDTELSVWLGGQRPHHLRGPGAGGMWACL